MSQEQQQQLADLKQQLDDTLSSEKDYQKLLEEIKHLERQLAESPSAAPAYPLREHPLCEGYLMKLFTKSGYVPLAEIAPEIMDDVESPPTLEAIYTALLTLSPEEHKRLQAGHAMPDNRKSALEQVNDHKYLVILGDPGSGKSTFVNFLALCLVGQWLQRRDVNLDLLTTPLATDDKKRPKPQPWKHDALLPVHVVLREFAATGLPTDETPETEDQLWQFISKQLKDEGREEFADPLKQHLLTYGGIFLLDGLDEVPETEQFRPHIKQAVEGIVNLFPRCRILVTSRTYAYQEKSWKLSNFSETMLSTFTAAQIRTFIRHWYTFISQSRGMNPEECLARADELHKQILHNSRLKELAERPILLTLMTSLHESHGKLPDKRVELYQETVKLLLKRWEWQKVTRITAQGEVVTERQSLLQVLETDQDKILELLGQLAYEAHATQGMEQNDSAYIDGYKLILGLRKLAKGKARRIDGEQIEHYLQNRAGILVAPDEGIYAFPHRSFQEYLAAKYLYEQDEYPEFPDNIAELARAQPNRWREVAFLAAALGRRKDVWELVEALCQNDVCPSRQSPEDAWGAILAGQAVRETIDVEDARTTRHCSKIVRLQHWLAAILTEQAELEPGTPFPAVERALAGRLLAQLGDDPRPGVGRRDDGLPDIAWCQVPAGSFWMGNDPDAMKREMPCHEVTLPAFEISRYPITNAQYQAFVDDDGYTEKWRDCWTKEGWQEKEERNWDGLRKLRDPFGLPNHPVVGVSWYEAMAFCRWLTMKTPPPTPPQRRGEKETPPPTPPQRRGEQETPALTQQDNRHSLPFGEGRGGVNLPVGEGRGGVNLPVGEGREGVNLPVGEGRGGVVVRLPSEAEWEYAARGPQGCIYPWGDEPPDPERANYRDTNFGETSAVGCFPRGSSRFSGCEEMAGNVWEWCLDVWRDTHDGAPTDGSARLEANDIDVRLLKGGSWVDPSRRLRGAYRGSNNRAVRSNYRGFRVVQVVGGHSSDF